jgi:hypothetical protein
MKFLAIIVVVLVLCFGALYAVARHDVVTKAQAQYSESGAPTATFSRFKATEKRGLAMFWKVHFAKQTKGVPSVAVWHFKPFGDVTFEGGKKPD